MLAFILRTIGLLPRIGSYGWGQGFELGTAPRRGLHMEPPLWLGVFIDA